MSEAQMLKSALWYCKEMNFSVIPVSEKKTPLIKWQQYQTEKPTIEQVQEWWSGKFKGANIGIVTGAISNLTVIDIDSNQGREALEEITPEALLTPTATTPGGGEHRYFRYQEGITNAVKFLSDCDARSEGGYIIAPPSTNGRGHYAWVDGLSIVNTEIAFLPEAYKHALNISNSIYTIGGVERGGEGAAGFPNIPNGHKRPRLTTNDHKIIPHTRDETLFHIANALIKGHLPIQEVQEILQLIAYHGCEEPYPVKDIPIKIQSVLTRQARQTQNITQEVREWVSTTTGYFTTTTCHSELQTTTKAEKKACNMALLRMVEEGIIERVGSKSGTYQRIEKECKTIDFMDADISDELNIVYPLGVHKFVHTLPKSIIVIAGTPDAGKTAMLLNLVALNMWKYRINYLSSEMGALEMKTRLANFDNMSLSDWQNPNFTVRERASDFASVIQPNDINIIDFLELHDNFYGVVEHIANIHKKLEKGIAVIALQKKENAKDGRGGEFSKEKARLYMTLDRDYPGSVLKITKAKNWRDIQVNPVGYWQRFKLVGGCKFMPEGWRKD